MTDRFVELEARVEALERAVRGLERGLQAPDPGDLAAGAGPEVSGLPETVGAARALPALVALAGRACLVLGGAFLIRAATEANALSLVGGAAAGLAYAGIWILLADRDGRLGRVASASVHGVTAAAIAYPLLWEACVRFRILSPGAAAGAVVLTTAVLLALSLRQPQPVLAWAATLGGPATLLAVMVSTGRGAPVALVLVVIAGAIVAIAEKKGWPGLRWPAAASLLIGYGMALSLARAGIPARGVVSLIGVGAILVGVAAYAAARAIDSGFYSLLALLMMLAGGAFWLPPAGLAWLWGALAIAASALAGRLGAGTLRWHAAVYVLAASGASGLAADAARAFVLSPGRGRDGLEPPLFFAFAAAAVSYGLLSAGRGTARDWNRAVPKLLIALPILAGFGAVVIRLLVAAAAGDPGGIAAMRTGVLAASSIAVAFVGTRARSPELSWLVYPFLILGGIKLLFEDVPRGRPMTLFVGFALYGAALLLAPRIARSRPVSPTSP